MARMNVSKANCPNCASRMNITRVVCSTCDIQIDAEFELPDLAQLPEEDQAFVVAFLHHHGSIKQTGEQLGISYPTVKSRLTSIAEKLPQFVRKPSNPHAPSSEILAQLDEGEISVEEALQLLDS